MPNLQVVTYIEFYNRSTSAISGLWLSNGAVPQGLIGVAALSPSLKTPFLIGSSLSVENYGQAIQGTIAGGTLEFAIDDITRIFFTGEYSAIGRFVYIFEGTGIWPLPLVFTGRIQNIAYNNMLVATVTFTDARLDLDKVFQPQLFGTDTLTPAELRGRPAPRLHGTCYGVEPVLVSTAGLYYSLSDANFIRTQTPGGLADIMDVRVGGISWTRVSGVAPGPGQWTYDDLLPIASFHLGGTTDGGDVRADARSYGWDAYTTGNLLRGIAVDAGVAVDNLRLDYINAVAPFLIGYRTSLDPIGLQDVFDQISYGIGGFWWGTNSGTIGFGVILAPSGVDYAYNPPVLLDEVNTISIQQEKLIPPAWKIKVEYFRNWDPGSQFYSALPEDQVSYYRSGGTVAEVWEDENIKIADPKAIEVPLIRTLVANVEPALGIRDRLVTAWRVSRRIINVKVETTTPRDLMQLVELNVRGFTGLFWVVGSHRSVGGGAHEYRLWG